MVDLDAARSGAFAGPVVGPDTPDAAAVLQETIAAVGGGGAARPFFDVTQAALSEPLISSENAGFLRPDSFLSVVVYSRRDDSSEQNGATFATWLEGLRDPEMVAFSGVTGPRGGILPCGLLGDAVDPAPRLGTAITNTDGLHMEICDYGAPAIVDDLSVFTAGLQSAFPLEREVTVDDWMYVVVDGEDVPRDGNNGWTYAAGLNEVRFHGEAIPVSGQTIEVSYPAAVPCP